MYLHGKGVKVDVEKSLKHFQSSADQGWPEGQLHLGNMYFKGLGVQRCVVCRCFRDVKQMTSFFRQRLQTSSSLLQFGGSKRTLAGAVLPGQHARDWDRSGPELSNSRRGER